MFFSINAILKKQGFFITKHCIKVFIVFLLQNTLFEIPENMTNYIQRDTKKRLLFSKYECKRIECSSIIHDISLPKHIRYHTIQQLNLLPRNSSRIRIKNRCVLSGRAHSVYRFCGFSRIKLRELAHQGRLVGMIKASW